MIGWHHLVEIKRIKELALSAFPPTHREPLLSGQFVGRFWSSSVSELALVAHQRAPSGHFYDFI
jgi:hypothetical protein